MGIEDKIRDSRIRDCLIQVGAGYDGSLQKITGNIVQCDVIGICPLQLNYNLGKPVCGGIAYYQMMDKIEQK